MARKRTKTRYEGVYYRTKENGVKVFDILFTRDGKKIWEKVGPAPTYSAEVARDIRGKRLKEVRHEDDLPRDKGEVPTFDSVATAYLEWAESKRSYRHDETRYRLHLKPDLGSKKVNEIGSLDAERLKKKLTDAGKAPATVKQALALLRAIFNKAKDWHLIDVQNPVKGVKLPKVDNARERLLSVEEVALLLDTLKEQAPGAYGPALLALHTGARAAELGGLTWADIDLKEKTVTFRGTKSGGTRRVPLNAVAAEYLEKVGAGASASLVFPDMDTAAYQDVVDALFNEGVTDRRHRVVFHSLRHCFTSRLVAAGVPLNVVMKLVGHTTLAMLQRYAHLAPGAQRDAVDLLAPPAERPMLQVVEGGT